MLISQFLVERWAANGGLLPKRRRNNATITENLVEAAGVEPFGFIFLDEHLPDSSRHTTRTVPADSAE